MYSLSSVSDIFTNVSDINAVHCSLTNYMNLSQGSSPREGEYAWADARKLLDVFLLTMGTGAGTVLVLVEPVGLEFINT